MFEPVGTGRGTTTAITGAVIVASRFSAVPRRDGSAVHVDGTEGGIVARQTPCSPDPGGAS
jgi:hypothetical protein